MVFVVLKYLSMAGILRISIIILRIQMIILQIFQLILRIHQKILQLEKCTKNHLSSVNDYLYDLLNTLDIRHSLSILFTTIESDQFTTFTYNDVVKSVRWFRWAL